jgi:hypothetical protein
VSGGDVATKDPIALTRSGATEVIAYACGVCGVVAGSVMVSGDAEAKRRAVQCCAPSVCRRCGKRTERMHRILCRDCEMDETWLRDAALFCKATPIDAAGYVGYVFDESADEYVASLEEAIERIDERAAEDPDAERAFYVYACAPYGLRKLDAKDIAISHCDNSEMYEDAHESLDVADLQRVLDEWHAKQSIESWCVDYSRVIVLDEAAASEYRAAYMGRKAKETANAK